MDSTRTGERGFTLLELLVCIGILAIVSAATAGAFAALARNATPGAARDVALMVAENTLARARAAAAYASPAQLLEPGERAFVAGAELRATAICGAAQPLRLRLPVVTTYDPAAARFTVVVTYPRDPCRVGAGGAIANDGAASVTLAETLPPPVYPPGHVIRRDVAPPARM